MNVLIIGGNGFIGSHLVDSLKNKHNVTVYDKSKNLFVEESNNVEYIYGDFDDTKLLEKTIEKKHLVFHLLSTTVPLTANNNPIFDIESNLVGTVKLLQIIIKKNVKRVVYVSSGGAVYGNIKNKPVDENSLTQPIGSYGIVKNAIESYVELFGQRHNLSTLIVRPSNVYGYRQNYHKNQGLIGKYMYACLSQSTFKLWGDGSEVRDYIFIDDLISFLLLASFTKETGIFNVGSGIGNSTNEILSILSKIVEHKPEINNTPKINQSVNKIILNTSKAERIFNWQPQISIENGLKLNYKWMKEHLNKATG